MPFDRRLLPGPRARGSRHGPVLKPNFLDTSSSSTARNDERRESGSDLLHVDNIVAGIAPIVCGFSRDIASRSAAALCDHGFDAGLVLARRVRRVAIGMAAGLVQYWLGQPNLRDHA